MLPSASPHHVVRSGTPVVAQFPYEGETLFSKQRLATFRKKDIFLKDYLMLRDFVTRPREGPEVRFNSHLQNIKLIINQLNERNIRNEY